MNENVIKQAVGVDVSQDSLDVSVGKMDSSFEVSIRASKKFKNTPTGIKSYAAWVQKNVTPGVEVVHVLEATGVYHEKLACQLYDKGEKVIVLLPQRAKAFTKTLVVKTVTDKEASKSLAIMGLEKKLSPWKKPDKLFLELKQLTREREQIQDHITQIKNALHAEKAGAWPNDRSIKRLKQQLSFYEKQKIEVNKDVSNIVKQNPELMKRIKKVATIPGIGVQTVVTVLAETSGFHMIQNKRQLVSYAGYDVIEKQSGTSVRGKAKISKRGNRHIRKALHMPALSAIRSNKESQRLFVRLVSKHGIKMKGVVAVQRKLLVLLYTLWKNDSVYDPEYGAKREGRLDGHPHELVLDCSMNHN